MQPVSFFQDIVIHAPESGGVTQRAWLEHQRAVLGAVFRTSTARFRLGEQYWAPFSGPLLLNSGSASSTGRRFTDLYCSLLARRAVPGAVFLISTARFWLGEQYQAPCYGSLLLASGSASSTRRRFTDLYCSRPARRAVLGAVFRISTARDRLGEQYQTPFSGSLLLASYPGIGFAHPCGLATCVRMYAG